LPARCTVVIPAYNAGRFLGEALECLRAQRLRDWRAVVVDDGSTDSTLATAQRFADPRFVVLHQENRGVSAARNRGLAEVDSPFVVFLDADDRLLPDSLERFVSALEANPVLTAVYGEGRLIDESGAPLAVAGAPRFNRRPSGDVLESLLRRNFILSGGALCARTARIRDAGSFREDLRLHEDWEYWCRLAQTGPFQYLGPEPVFEYRRSGQSAVATSGTDIAHTMQSVAAVFENAALGHRFPPGQLLRLRKRSEASVYSFAASQEIKAGRLREAAAALRESIRSDPRQPREWVLLGLCMARWMPGAVLRNIK
jgi:glycosyltransferase involved in cell wall biosynthesis